ncbi:5673_t:CDS:2, partial [Racocetra persica]
MSLSPPSTGNFENREALINHVQTYALSYGYAYDKGGHYINRLNLTNETRQRATSTRLIDCPFELYGKKMKDSQWYLTIKNEKHNHEASQDISDHPSNDPDKLAILKTIYNARDKIRRDNLQGHIPIQALLDKLVEENFEHDYQCDQNDNLTHLFFNKEDNYVWGLNRVAHIFENIPKPKVIITDRELALMHAVHTVFPESQNILCVWHIEKNMLTS